MKLIAFSIYDEKAECFGHPFFFSAIGLATRLFKEWVNNPNTPPGKHPTDFKLYQVGAWNDAQAKFETVDVPKFIGNGTDYLTHEYTDEREVDGKTYVLKEETK